MTAQWQNLHKTKIATPQSLRPFSPASHLCFRLPFSWDFLPEFIWNLRKDRFIITRRNLTMLVNVFHPLNHLISLISNTLCKKTKLGWWKGKIELKWWLSRSSPLLFLLTNLTFSLSLRIWAIIQLIYNTLWMGFIRPVEAKQLHFQVGQWGTTKSIAAKLKAVQMHQNKSKRSPKPWLPGVC